MTSLWAESYLLITPITSQTCHANPKLKSGGAGRYQFLPAGGMPTARSHSKDFSPKSQDAVALQQIAAWRFVLAIDRVISVRQSTVAANIWASLPGAGYGRCSGIRLTAWLQKLLAGGTVRDWCMSRVTAIISALVICIIVCLSWAVNHYRDNAITWQSPARQKCQRTEAGGTRQLLTCRCVSVMLLRSM